MLKICSCKKCNHEWVARRDTPTICPRCRSYRWQDDVPAVILHSHTCLRCGNEWQGRLGQPKQCPKCKSQRWDFPGTAGIYGHTCLRCDNKWQGRTDTPKQCPKCHNQRWQEGREIKEPLYKLTPDGRRVGIRCQKCMKWYPIREDKRNKCPCGSMAGGTMEIEKQEGLL